MCSLAAVVDANWRSGLKIDLREKTATYNGRLVMCEWDEPFSRILHLRYLGTEERFTMDYSEYLDAEIVYA